MLVIVLYMLEKQPWNSILLYMLVEIMQLVHEISRLPEVSQKKLILKNFSKFTCKQSSILLCQKSVLKNFKTFLAKHRNLKLYLKRDSKTGACLRILWILWTSANGRFWNFNKVTSLTKWRPVTLLESDSSTGSFSVIFANFSEKLFCKIPHRNHFLHDVVFSPFYRSLKFSA